MLRESYRRLNRRRLERTQATELNSEILVQRGDSGIYSIQGFLLVIRSGIEFATSARFAVAFIRWYGLSAQAALKSREVL